MLFTDALILATSDILKLDSEVPDIAATAQPAITLTDVLNDAQQEVASQLLGLGGRFFGRWTNQYNGPTYGMQSLFTESSNRPRYSLSQVVVTDAEYPALWGELKRYLAYVTLYNFYRDASRRQNAKDRYGDKRDMYQEEIRCKYWPRLIKAGIPMIAMPMSCPGAIWEAGSGTWGASNLSAVSGGTASGSDSYDIAISWTDTTKPLNNESAPSAIATIAITTGQRVQISIANLTAPNGIARNASSARIPVNTLTANQWNIYAAVSEQPLMFQASVPYATKTALQDVPTTTGASVGVGQYADLFLTVLPNQLMRS